MTEDIIPPVIENNPLSSNTSRSIQNNPTSPSISQGYNPRPTAIDIYNRIVGNPITGSNPGTRQQPITIQESLKQSNDYTNTLVDYARQKASAPMAPEQQMQQYSYNGDHDGAKFERYYNSKPFKELGFSPFRDNEHLYNNNMTWGDEFVRAAGQWPSLVSTGFRSGIRSWGTLFTDPLAPDLQGAEEMKKIMALGSSSKEGAGSFFINTFLNSGYTIGIGVDILAEMAVVTAVTRGMGLPGVFARAGTKIAQASEILGAVKEVPKISALKTFFDTNKVGQVLAKTGSIINPLERTWEVGKDILSGANALSATKLGKINEFARWSKNFGEFAKDVVMIKTAVSEAQLEGGMVHLDVTKDLIQVFRDKNNGAEPTGEELAKIENIARDKANTTALWNLPAIMWSNKFMYETMFAPFEKTAKKGMSNLVDDLLFKKDIGFTAVKAGLAGTAQKIRAGITQPKAWGKFGYNYLKLNSAEGVQENIQEAISSGAKAHALSTYNNPDRGAYEGYMGHFMNGVKDQFSAQGAETFAGGFVMGAMAHPFMSAPMWAGQTILNNTINKKDHIAYQTQRDEQLVNTATILNEFYHNTGNYLAPDMINAINQGVLQKDFHNANQENNRKEAEDAKSTSKFEHLYTALSTGKLDLMLDKFKTFKEFTPEQAAEAFHVKDGVKALSMIDEVITRAKSIQENYNDVSSSYPNPYDPFRYEKGSEERIAQEIAYEAWEGAKKNLVFARTEFINHNKRIKDLGDVLITKRNPIKNVSSQDLFVLMSREQMSITTNSLRVDIKNTDTTTPEGKKILKEKEDRLSFLTELSLRFETLGVDQKPEYDAPLKKAFKNYINHIAGTTDDVVFDDELIHALGLIKDNYTLKDERASLVKSINVINNPKGFLNLQRNLVDIHKEIVKNREDFINANLKKFADNVQLNNAVNELYKRTGVVLTDRYTNYVEASLSL